MRAVDTNVLVRLIVQDDAQQAAAAARLVESGAWVSVLALAETMWVLSSVYKLPAGKIAAALAMLLDNDKLSFQSPEVLAASVKMFRSKPSLRFSDCLLVELARHSGYGPLSTFDRRLGSVDGAQLIE
jgi:predicted nucleic acid-binding protein